MKAVLIICMCYLLQTYKAAYPTIPSIASASSTTGPFVPTLPIVMPVKIPSPLNDPLYYQYYSAFTSYHALIWENQTCSGKNVINNLAIRQHNTTYYLKSQKYYVSFKSGTQYFTGFQNADCTWSIMSKQGLFLSLKPAYTYLMLEPTITKSQKFTFKQKPDFLYIQSAGDPLYYWGAINGIGRLGRKQGSRFVIQVWPSSASSFSSSTFASNAK